MPKISIIIPVYNVEKYLVKCLDSVRAQTFTDWEAICVNDGSPDKCGKILDEYAKKDNRIKIVTQSNQGLSIARNNGLKQAKGDWICFLDSDDFIHPQLLDITYQLAQKECCEMVCFYFQYYKDDSQISMPDYSLNQLKYVLTKKPLYYQKKRHKYKIIVNSWGKLYKKDLISNLSFIPNITYEDYPHTYAVLAKCPKTVILNIPLYYYRSNDQSISSSKMSVKNIQDYHTGLNSIIKIYEKAPKKAKRFVLYNLFPNILKQQFNKIERISKENKSDLWKAFAEELSDLKQKGWLKPWGHKIRMYLKYKKIIKGSHK